MWFYIDKGRVQIAQPRQLWAAIQRAYHGSSNLSPIASLARAFAATRADKQIVSSVVHGRDVRLPSVKIAADGNWLGPALATIEIGLLPATTRAPINGRDRTLVGYALQLLHHLERRRASGVPRLTHNIPPLDTDMNALYPTSYLLACNHTAITRRLTVRIARQQAIMAGMLTVGAAVPIDIRYGLGGTPSVWVVADTEYMQGHRAFIRTV